jgi:nucleoside-diphosphate-sugar epimerase
LNYVDAPKFMMAPSKLPQVFLTGAAGYIGAHILDQLFKVWNATNILLPMTKF